MNEQSVYIVELCMAISGLWFLFWEYRNFMVDSLRQDLFEVRDRFFIDAAEGRIRFDSAAYGTLRITLNGMIRFAHDLSFTRCLLSFLITWQLNPHAAEAYRRRMAEAIERLPDNEGRKIVIHAHRAMFLAVIRHVSLTSIPMLLWVAALAVLSPLRRMTAAWERIEKEEQARRKEVAILGAEAYGLGEDESAAITC